MYIYLYTYINKQKLYLALYQTLRFISTIQRLNNKSVHIHMHPEDEDVDPIQTIDLPLPRSPGGTFDPVQHVIIIIILSFVSIYIAPH